MTKSGKKLIASATEGVEIARGTSDPCPICGLNRVIVGRAHNCRPRSKTLDHLSKTFGKLAADVLNEVTTVDNSCHNIVDKTIPKVDNTPEKLTKPNVGGRPSTTGKPWLTEGISRQAWYKRRSKI